jgi:hypothetical protein
MAIPGFSHDAHASLAQFFRNLILSEYLADHRLRFTNILLRARRTSTDEHAFKGVQRKERAPHNGSASKAPKVASLQYSRPVQSAAEVKLPLAEISKIEERPVRVEPKEELPDRLVAACRSERMLR